MLKKLNSPFLLMSVILLLCCDNKRDSKTLSNPVTKAFTDTINNANTINDLYQIAKKELRFPYSNLIISNSNFDYGYNEYSIDKNIDNVLFIKDSINSISFSNNEINNLTFSDCHINNLLITSSKIKNLKIKNCQINSIEIISSPFSQITFSTLPKDTIKKIIIKNCEDAKDISFDGNFNEITFDGGQIDELDITKIQSKNTILKILGTKLLYPNFYDNNSNNVVVFANSSITPSSFGPNFILKEDREFNNINSLKAYNTSRVEIFNRFRFVEQSYGILSDKLDKTNNKQLSNYFYYRTISQSV